MKKKKQTALISGMSGFIGGHLAKYLENEGWEVVGIKNADLFDLQKIEKIFSECNPDYVFHLASYGNHVQQGDIDEMFSSNVIKSFTFFRYASMMPSVKAIINFSSGSVYGEYPFPLREEFKPISKRFYAVTKVCAEYLAEGISYQTGKPFITIRPFSVYGENEAETRFIPTVIDSILTDKEFTLYAPPLHDWIYITDFIRAVLMIVKYEPVGHSIWNVGNGVTFTNADVVEMLEQVAGKRANYRLKEEKRADNDFEMLEVDISKLIELGYTPLFSLKKGLEKVYEATKARQIS